MDGLLLWLSCWCCRWVGVVVDEFLLLLVSRCYCEFVVVVGGLM